jgi:hypothetical protein
MGLPMGLGLPHHQPRALTRGPALAPGLTHDLASGRARVGAIVSSSSVPSQRSNTLPYED